MKQEAKARLIIQSASLQGIPADEIIPQLLRLGLTRAEAESAIRDYRMRTDIAFRLPRQRRRLIGLILLFTGIALVVGPLVWVLLFG